MMRFLTKVRIFNSYNSLINQHLGNFSFSSHSKCNQNHFNPKKTQKNSPKNTNDSLFSDITGILVSENLNVGGNLSGFSVGSVNVAGFSGGGECTQRVRRNVVEKNEGDVSGIVGKITEVVRGYHGEVSMAELLDKSGFEMSPDIVCKVLKRCFKVPHLGKRFFEWVKVKHASCVTTENYNTMLYMAGDVKDFELVERLLEEMEEYNCEKDVKTWTIILMHYGKAKLVGKALSTFEKMRRLSVEPDVEAYRILIQLLCKFKKGEIALEFYKEMVRKGFELESRVCPYLLNCLAGCGDVDGVYVVVNDMINVSQIPEHDAYSCALKSFCIAGRITEALGLIQDLNDKNVSLSPVFYETLVKGLCKAHRVDDALEIVEIMSKRNAVNEVVYGALVNGYLRKKDVSKALDLFYRMKEAGFKPLTSTYTELMQRHFHSNEYKKGCALYNEMLETGVKLDTVAYTAMIAGHVRHGHISAAWKVFRSMENDGIRPTQKCFLIFVKELCRSSSEAKEIFKVLIYMLDSNFNIGNEVTDCVTSYFERKKDVVNLERIKAIIIRRVREFPEIRLSRDDSSLVKIQTREETSVESNVKCLSLEPLPQPYSDEDLRKLRDILSSDHDWFSMKEALEKLTICYTPALVSETLDVCGRHGSAALHFFSWVRNQPGYRHTTETYNSAIKIAGKGKDFKHMRYLFHEMQRNRCLVTPDTWTIMIMLYGRVGLTDIASRIFSEMKTSGCKPTTNVYKYLLLSFCGKKGRKVDEAIKLFSEMISAGLVPDKELVEVCFDCFCQAGKLEEARKCLKRLQKVGFSTPLSYSLLIRALCRVGKLDDALALANDVKEDRSTLDHYIGGSVVHSLLKKGRLDEALSKIKTMKEDGICPTVHVYTSLISHFCKAKDIDRALDIFKTMYEEGCHPTVVTYTALIYGFINTNNFETAQKLFLRMRYKGPFPDFKTYSILISSLCEKGESEAAFRFLSEMMNDGIVPSTINFRTVFFGLNREGKQHLARKVMLMKHDVTSKRKFTT